MEYASDEKGLFEAINQRDALGVARLLKLNYKYGESYFGIRFLDLAVSLGDVKIMELLLKSPQFRRRIDNFDEMSHTPLIQAVQKGDFHMVKLLLNAGADVNAHEVLKAGNTSLREAVGNGDVEIIKLLLEAGASPEIKGWMGVSALAKAERLYNKHPSENGATILSMLQSAICCEKEKRRQRKKSSRGK